MSRHLKAQRLATVVVLAGAAWPAAADEGPAINPSIYKVTPGAKTINVDCDGQQTLTNALADKSGADLNIVFSGTCKEYVYIQRDGVAIRGKDATATVAGAIEVTASKRILLEGFTCRDNAQLEYCIGALLGSSVTLHNMKVFNSNVRGVLIFNSAALIEGLTIDKTVSTSVLIRGSQVRLEGELTFTNSMEGCVTIDSVSSVFSKSGVLSSRDCMAGLLVQNNSTFEAPFATFNLNHNTFAGLALITQGTFSYGGTVVAKNNTQAGIFVDELASFGPFSNLKGTSSITLADNGYAGVYVTRGSTVELSNLRSNSGSTYGVFVDDGFLRINNSKISGNTSADVRLQFGSRAVFGNATDVGPISCDGSQLMRGSKTTCTVERGTSPSDKPGDAKPDAAKPGSPKSGN